VGRVRVKEGRSGKEREKERNGSSAGKERKGRKGGLQVGLLGRLGLACYFLFLIFLSLFLFQTNSNLVEFK
jgi:hypothetical protein